MQSALGIGHVVAGRYRLLDQVGRGAMGIVWRCRDELLDREVAIKQILLPPMASGTQAQASYKRTLREARTAARLSHPGVVTVFDVVEDSGSPWIVMELIKARPLDQVIAEDGPLPPARAAQLGLGLLDALSTAHQAGVLHRDVKPSNVLISPDGKAILTDFGIATIQGDPGLTQAGMVVGTPGFSPPERIRGGKATPASDLWSLGATLYAAVEGRGPFDRAGGSAAIVASIATEPAPRAPSAGPLAPVIDALLRAEPADRPDAATTAKMLTQAWKAARMAGRIGIGVDHQPNEPASNAANPRNLAGSEATTATQMVTVPPDQDEPALARAVSAVSAVSAVGALGAEGVADAAAVKTDLAGAPGAPGAPDTPVAADAVDVVPDLMATPNFADLKMPSSTLSADESLRADSLGLADPVTPPAAGRRAGAESGAGGNRDGKASEFGKSRRRLVALTTIAALAIVAGIIYVTLPSHGNPFAPFGIGGGSNQNPIAAHLGHATRVGHRVGSQSGGEPGSGGAPSGSRSPSGQPTPPGKPTPSGKRSSHGKSSASPTPTKTTSPSPTPDPTPTPSSTGTGGSPPPGYVWDSVTAASVGTIAGFRIAGPATWAMTPGLNTVIRPVNGPGRLDVNLTQWPVAGPIPEARHLQAVATARHKYPRYQLISMVATRFRGWPAARWTFWWQPTFAANPIEVTELLFTAQTWQGPQQYIMWISAPQPRIGWALNIFHVAMRTFKVLPLS